MNMINHPLSNTIIEVLFFVLLVLFLPVSANAAVLGLSPNTGVYSVGSSFTVNVVVNTEGKPINAADTQLSYNPRELSVVSVNRSSSIFNLWTQEPTFSNTAGTITFGGGSPTGYTGSSGVVASVTFRALAAGTPKVTFTSGSVLAADGLGTNVLKSMSGGSYTLNAPQTNPEPEYIAPANTPKAPAVTSTTHPDPEGWYNTNVAELSWQLPSDVTAVRTLLDDSPSTIPTILYDSPISSRTIDDLPEGVSYFHIQFKNTEGWGKVSHYRLGVDTQPPSAFSISLDRGDPLKPEKVLIFESEDISPIHVYTIQVGAEEPFDFEDTKNESRYTLPPLSPGRHSVIVTAYDSAGNSTVATLSFEIASFERPTFTEYPERLTEGVIPALKGMTRPDSTVTVTVTSSSGATEVYDVVADSNGSFIFIPNTSFSLGVYEITAIAKDPYGALSDTSEPVKLIVEEPGFIRVGSFVVSVLSVIIPLIALLTLLIFGMWYLIHRLNTWRRRIISETKEAEEKLRSEFKAIVEHLNVKVAELRTSRGGKLTKAESALIGQIEEDLKAAERKIGKEISDIDDVVE